MLTKANPTVIGAFVIGAIILAIAGLLVFGGSGMFRPSMHYVVYFDGEVQGLSVGSPVSFHGVEVGSVDSVDILIDSKTRSVVIKAVINLEKGKAMYTGVRERPEQLYKEMVARGLRAQLRSQSMVTGQLYVALTLMPGTTARFRDKEHKYQEIPTVPTDLEKLKDTLAQGLAEIRKLPFKEIVTNLEQMLAGVNKIVNADDVKKTLRALTSTMTRLDNLAETIGKEIRPLMSQMTGATSETARLLGSLNSEIAPVTASLRTASDAAAKALEQATRTLETAERVGGQDSSARQQFVETMEELQAAARSLRELTDYLERHPESLIRGKTQGGEQ